MDTLKSAKKVVGLNQTIKYVQRNLTKKVFVARDADFRITGEVNKLIDEYGIEVIYVNSMKELGKACGIDVDAAIACVVEE